MNTLLWRRRLQYRMHQLGPMGLLGLALLIASVALWLGLVQPAELEAQRLANRVQARQTQLATLSQTPRVAELSKEEKIDYFYKSFPAVNRVPEQLNNIYRAAGKNGLTLETGEYALLQSETDKLARYRVALPVKGSFQQVLAFMDAVLKEIPSTALESAGFKRDKVDDPAVDAKLVFIVFVEAQP
jgi:Tfp pilus assembly protein PilO